MKRKIEHIYGLFRSLESSYSQSGFESAAFAELILQLKSLQDEKDLELLKICAIHVHLRKDMSLRAFLYWIVPIERYLNKSLKDEDFIIFNRDHFSQEKKQSAIPLVIILDNIRSSFNVGSMFRTAEAFNVEKIILTGYSPDPMNPKTQKTTLGSHQYIAWESRPNCIEVIESLKRENFRVIAAETTNQAIDIAHAFDFQAKTAFVFGNERFGMDSEVIKVCDETRQISLPGIKNSLNVANCASIFMFEFSRQFRQFSVLPPCGS